MALRGSIKEFGLADILQLIYFQKKTGVLEVEGLLDTVKIYFHEGNIVSTRSAKRPEENRIGNILVKRGILTEEELKEAFEEQTQSGTRLGSVLIQKGLVPKEVLVDIITKQITDQIVQIFTWKAGTYEFTPQGVPADRELGISLDTQHMLMEGLRVVDEWSVIEGTLTIDSVFRKTEKALTDVEIELTDDEIDVLDLVDGESDVSTIIELSGKDDFVVSKALVSLLDKGMIEPVEMAEKVVAERPPKRTTIARLTTYLIPAALSLGLLVSTVPAAVKGLSTLKRLKASKRLEQLRLSVEAHRIKTGSYPEVFPWRVTDPWGNPYVYLTDADGYRLFSAGPDGEPGTDDDVY